MSGTRYRRRSCAMAGVLALAGQLGAAALAQDIQTDEARGARALQLQGLVEVEAFAGDDREGTGASDIRLATVELTANARLNEWSRAVATYLFEQDDTDPGDIDQVILVLGDETRAPLFLSVGRMYVPFGSFESAMISDPLTLELGETRESALQVGYGLGAFRGSVYVFNRNARKAADNDRVIDYGAAIGFAAGGIDAGVDYISSLADSDANRDAIAGVASPAREMPAVSVHVAAHAGPFSVIGEYVGAIHDFDSADRAFDGSGARPDAWNVELDYGFALLGHDAAIAIGRQGTSEAVGLGVPRTRTLATVSVVLSRAMALSVEYALADDYDTADDGSGKHAGTFTVQLAAQF